MTATNAKFAITTQSGRSIVKEFTSYAEAQKYADRHFGKGSIVQMVGNSVACNSTNPVVRKAVNAVALNLKLIPFVKAKVEPGDSVWYRGREFNYIGSAGSTRVEIEDIFEGERDVVSVYDKDLNMAANATASRENV